MNIFVSTGGYYNETAVNTAYELLGFGINKIELSGGIHSNNQIEEVLELATKCSIQLHNYFPPSKLPFVFNLASEDPAVEKLSINHALNAIDITSKIGGNEYSFHAGFRINPSVRELGKKLSLSKLVERKISLEIFEKNVKYIANYAEKKNINLLIENNVINNINFKRFGEDPLLLTDPIEIDKFMSFMPSNVGILLDVGHLKVSSTVLNFDLEGSLLKINKWIKGYHLSDNEGEYDTNSKLTNESWFWGQLMPNLKYTIEVYGLDKNELNEQYIFAKEKINKIIYEYEKTGKY